MSGPVVPADASFEEIAEPYDVDLDGSAAVEAALAQARQDAKRVWLTLGASWCPDCRILAGMMQIAPLEAFIQSHFETVSVYIGRYDANMDVPARFGLTEGEHGGLVGVPAILILSEQGEVLNADTVYDWRPARSLSPADLGAYAARYAKAD